MRLISNPYRGIGLEHADLVPMPYPADDATRALGLIARCPDYRVTPLTHMPTPSGVPLWIKDERQRMGLGSFKALGAAYVIARDAEDGRAKGQTYVAASAGNHGLSVAAGARVFGAASRIYLSETVPESFAKRLRAEGADVRGAGATYEESMAEAARAADAEGLTLLSDSSWPGYASIPHVLMEGYLILMAEVIAQADVPPSHIFLQAGVGGLAGAVAALARKAWGDTPVIVVVEPDAAPALAGSIAAGAPRAAQGPVSAMGRLDCKEPSLIALKGLARDADHFMTISEAEGAAGAEAAAAMGLPSTPSGAAGIAGVLAGAVALKLGQKDSILTILSEST